MTPRARKTCLASLRDEIASLRVIKCHMAHERVVWAGAPAQSPAARDPRHNVQRIGLCSPDERDERLGCSHTMSRTKLDRAINELAPGKAAQLGRELNWLTNEIHLLDHRKGEAEARLAFARREAGGRCDDVQALELIKEAEEVRRLERQHDEYVERIGVLKDTVVAEIERMLKETAQ